MGKITIEGREFPIAGNEPNAAEQRAIARFLANEARTPTPSDQIGAAIAAAGDPGRNVVRNNQGQEVDAEGNVVPEPGGHQPSGPSSGGQNRPALARVEDVATRMADSSTFGLAPRFSASDTGRFISRVGQTPITDLIRGKIIPDPNAGLSSDELLAKRRQEVKAAGERLGPEGTLAADIAGGAITGSALQRSGATVLGHVPRTAGLLTKTGAGVAEGALYGGGSAAGHTDDPSKLGENILEGAVTGGATGGLLTAGTNIIPRVITPFPTTDPVRAKAMETLRQYGVDVTAGTKTGDPKLRLAEDIVSKLPLGGNLTKEQMPQVTAAVMKKAGIEGNPTAATPDVVKGGFNKVGGEINRLQAPHTIDVDNTMLNAVSDVEHNIKPLVGDGYQKPLQHFIDKLSNQATFNPKEAQAVRTQLNEAINNATDTWHRQGLVALKESLDDALERVMTKANNADDIAALNLARNQYLHLNILVDALGRSGGAGKRGELTPSALAGAVEKSVGRPNYYKGQGDLNDLASASAGYLQPPKDSYTQTRANMGNPFNWAGGAVGRALLGNTGSQRYWGNQVLPTPPVSGAQVQPAVAGAAGPADRLVEGLLRNP